MYSVMIVEDELLVRLGLSGSVPWEELGMQLVTEVSNGIAALEQFKKWRPNIIMTDIRMPGMDGLSLIREIRRIDSECAIIVITCMEDFQTLHTAMEFNISGYLLKATMTQDDILSMLRKARDSLSDRMDQKAAVDSSGKWMLFDALQAYLVKRSISYMEFLSQCSKVAEMPSPPQALINIYLHRDGGYPKLLVQSIGRMFVEKLSNTGVTQFTDERQLLYLLQDNVFKTKESIYSSLIDVIDYATDNLNVRIRIFLCKIKPGFQHIPDVLRACENLYSESYFADSQIVILDEELAPDDDRINEWLSRLRGVRELGYAQPSVRDKYLRLIDGLKESIVKGRQKYQDALYALVVYMSHALKVFPPEKIELYQQYLHSASSLRQVITTFDQLMESSHLSGKIHNREIGTIIDFMHNHPDQNIALHDMAKKVNLSPNYFSRLFKDETGISFSEYLAYIRLECAKMLLRGDYQSIQEIAMRCGFIDVAYFSRFFKQKTGMPPSAWRKMQ